MSTPGTKQFYDQLGREITIPFPPRRIVSLVPSQTELLHYLGLEKEVTGITKFCIHPHTWFKTKTRVGGTKTITIEKVKQLNPDLIIANKEENEQTQIEALAKEFPVWISDILTLDNALEMISCIGEITGKSTAANHLEKEITSRFHRMDMLSSLKNHHRTATVLYLIWNNPYMAAGTDTFINDMLTRCGFNNIAIGRYPVFSDDELKKTNPSVILLSSEPYPFKQQHAEAIQRVCPDAIIKLVDGELFSWYGSRLLAVPDYFLRLSEEIRALSQD